MVVTIYTTVNNYLIKNNCNATVRDAFENWRKIIQRNDFGNLNDLKKVFRTVDYVGNDRYVFNILSNNYRLIVMIHFSIRTVYSLFVGTHSEYDKVNATTIIYKK